MQEGLQLIQFEPRAAMRFLPLLVAAPVILGDLFGVNRLWGFSSFVMSFVHVGRIEEFFALVLLTLVLLPVFKNRPRFYDYYFAVVSLLMFSRLGMHFVFFLSAGETPPEGYEEAVAQYLSQFDSIFTNSYVSLIALITFHAYLAAMMVNLRIARGTAVALMITALVSGYIGADIGISRACGSDAVVWCGSSETGVIELPGQGDENRVDKEPEIP